MLGEVGLAETEVEGIMKKADTDGSGTIDYSEFVMACINLKKLLNKEQLQYAFSQFDKVGLCYFRTGADLYQRTSLRLFWAWEAMLT